MKPLGKLKIHRETLRLLSGQESASAAAGTGFLATITTDLLTISCNYTSCYPTCLISDPITRCIPEKD